MRLKLNEQHLQAIHEHGRRTYPHECCGLMLGRFGEHRQTVEVHELMSVDNDREQTERHNRYTIPPKTFMRAEKRARAEGLEVIGFYHSHPDVAAVPSAYDLEHAWPVYAYVIVSIRQGTARETTCWRMREDRSAFDEVPLEIQTAQADPQR
jgi:proteasome lid subunit RPN8/RPN11